MRPAHIGTVVFVGLMSVATAVMRLGHPPGGQADRGGAAATGFRIDVNSADADTLRLLPGIGPGLAARIIEHRGQHGPFTAPQDLTDVSGIGPKTLARMLPFVTCGPGDPNSPTTAPTAPPDPKPDRSRRTSG